MLILPIFGQQPKEEADVQNPYTENAHFQGDYRVYSNQMRALKNRASLSQMGQANGSFLAPSPTKPP